MLTLKVLSQEQGRLVPTYGGMLLFGKDRERYFPDAWVQCGRFRGIEKVHIFDQQEIHKPLPVALAHRRQAPHGHVQQTLLQRIQIIVLWQQIQQPGQRGL